MEKNFKQILNDISTFVFDVDGVLTDGSVVLMPDGEQVRTMNIKDGYALQLAVKKGYNVVIISGGKSEAVRSRLMKLGIKDIYLGAGNKLEVFEDHLLVSGLSASEILYMGDDIPDYEVMTRVALPTCPNDSASEIMEISKYVSQKKGGHGCVRDVIEQVLRVHGKWADKDGLVW